MAPWTARWAELEGKTLDREECGGVPITDQSGACAAYKQLRQLGKFHSDTRHLGRVLTSILQDSVSSKSVNSFFVSL